MIRFGDALDILSKTNVQILEMAPRIFVLKIYGHPTDCINGAHKIFTSQFNRPWAITEILAKSPKEVGRFGLSDWEFTVTAKATY